MEYIPIHASDYSFDLIRSCVKNIKWPKNRTNFKGISTNKFHGNEPVAHVDVVFKNDNNTTKTMHWSLSGNDIYTVLDAFRVDRDRPFIASSMYEADVKKLIRCLCQIAYGSCNFSGYAKLTSMRLKYL